MYGDEYYDFLRRAEAGEEFAMELLGEYLFGDMEGDAMAGFPRDPREGERWLNKVIEETQDLKLKCKALHQLAAEYEDGASLPQDLHKAMELYKKAADLNTGDARHWAVKERYEILRRHLSGGGDGGRRRRRW